jgi:Cu/Ag efflux protein CusF
MKFRLALATAALAALTAAAIPALAQHKHGTTTPATQSAVPEMADGEVRRIDPAKGTVLLKHGEIKSINMGAMTMGFKLKDPAQAAGLKVGDKVKFAVEQKGDELIVTQIQKVN